MESYLNIGSCGIHFARGCGLPRLLRSLAMTAGCLDYRLPRIAL
ncbi:hypothetical protein [Helicobacter sp. MIT 05-5294]|nr:hypothetical protein [Helicobacter sp. MIT 05-5294]